MQHSNTSFNLLFESPASQPLVKPRLLVSEPIVLSQSYTVANDFCIIKCFWSNINISEVDFPNTAYNLTSVPIIQTEVSVCQGPYHIIEL